MLRGGPFFKVSDFEQFPVKNEFEKEPVISENPCQKFWSSCDVSKAFPLWLTYIFISPFDEVVAVSKAERLHLFIRRERQPLTPPRNPWITSIKPPSVRKLPSPITDERGRFCHVWKEVRLRGFFPQVLPRTEKKKIPKKLNGGVTLFCSA